MAPKLYRLTDAERALLDDLLDVHQDSVGPVREQLCARIRNELRHGKVEQDDQAAHALVRMMWLYPNYRVDSRGPAGCIYDALKRIAPDVAAELENEDLGMVVCVTEVAFAECPGPDDPFCGRCRFSVHGCNGAPTRAAFVAWTRTRADAWWKR